jgi:hypothetical protein
MCGKYLSLQMGIIIDNLIKFKRINLTDNQKELLLNICGSLN